MIQIYSFDENSFTALKSDKIHYCDEIFMNMMKINQGTVEINHGKNFSEIRN